jgi:hypothetical protein
VTVTRRFERAVFGKVRKQVFGKVRKQRSVQSDTTLNSMCIHYVAAAAVAVALVFFIV